jgi:cellulose 1,4-beta-cellobiosidase
MGSTSGTGLTVSPLSSGRSYAFTVRARDAAGNVSGPSAPVAFTPDRGAHATGCGSGPAGFPALLALAAAARRRPGARGRQA